MKDIEVRTRDKNAVNSIFELCAETLKDNCGNNLICKKIAARMVRENLATLIDIYEGHLTYETQQVVDEPVKEDCPIT